MSGLVTTAMMLYIDAEPVRARTLTIDEASRVVRVVLAAAGRTLSYTTIQAATVACIKSQATAASILDVTPSFLADAVSLVMQEGRRE